MNFSDLIIVYLAFGAPVAAYKYLHARNIERRVKIATSLAVWLSWIPVAARLGYRYLTNAYSGTAFVSQKNLDAADAELSRICESTKASLLSSGCSLSMHDVRETLERYVGLSLAINGNRRHEGSTHALFEATESAGSELQTVCLLRRNRRRLERHHIYARRDFLAIFQQLSPTGRSAMSLGLELASRLGDREAVRQLRDHAGTWGEVWNPQHNELTPVPTSTTTPLTSSTAVLSSD